MDKHTDNQSITWLRGYKPCLPTAGICLGTRQQCGGHPDYQSFLLPAGSRHLRYHPLGPSRYVTVREQRGSRTP